MSRAIFQSTQHFIFFFQSVEVNAPAFLIDLFSAHSLYCSHINLTANFQHHIGFPLLPLSTGLRKQHKRCMFWPTLHVLLLYATSFTSATHI